MKKLLIGMAFFLTAGIAQALEVGDKVPCVHLVNIYPDTTEQQECIASPLVEGQKVVLEFFQTTCGACLDNMPAFNSLSAQTEGKAFFRLVGLDRKEKALRQFATDHKADLKAPIALDMDRVASKAYGIQYTPTSYVVHNDVIVFKHIGTWEKEQQVELQKLLAE